MHHAYLLVGAFEDSLTGIPAEDREQGPDVLFSMHERFGIDEARALKHEATLRPVARPYRTFVLSLQGITVEAQNGLLKLFEEPHETIRFYILVPTEDLLIPTLRSRLMLIGGERRPFEVSEEAKRFLESSYRDRLTEIAERTKEADTVWSTSLLDGIEVWAEKKGDREALEAVLFVRKYAARRGASKKILFEHLALSLSVPERT